MVKNKAICVNADGRLHETQIGIWEDKQIEGFSRLVEAVHAEGLPFLA